MCAHRNVFIDISLCSTLPSGTYPQALHQSLSSTTDVVPVGHPACWWQVGDMLLLLLLASPMMVSVLVRPRMRPPWRST